MNQKIAVLTLLSQNIQKRNSALPLPGFIHTRWAKGLGLKRGGDTILYTGQMYQMVPYLLALQRRQRGIPSKFYEKLIRIILLINPVINVSFLGTIGAVKREERDYYFGVLKKIVALLRANGLEPGYLYEKELYAGTLAHDLGLERVFKEHAIRLSEIFKKEGVKTIITVDPHSTDMFKRVYPKAVKGFDFEVKSYLELLVEKGAKGLKAKEDEEVVIHDSCVYARYLDVIEAPRRLLKKARAKIKEPRFSGEITHCCGGPAESIFPEKAREVAKNRVDELTKEARTIVTMCPICHLNLKEACGPDGRVEDLALWI